MAIIDWLRKVFVSSDDDLEFGQIVHIVGEDRPVRVTNPRPMRHRSVFEAIRDGDVGPTVYWRNEIDL